MVRLLGGKSHKDLAHRHVQGGEDIPPNPSSYMEQSLKDALDEGVIIPIPPEEAREELSPQDHAASLTVERVRTEHTNITTSTPTEFLDQSILNEVQILNVTRAPTEKSLIKTPETTQVVKHSLVTTRVRTENSELHEAGVMNVVPLRTISTEKSPPTKPFTSKQTTEAEEENEVIEETASFKETHTSDQYGVEHVLTSVEESMPAGTISTIEDIAVPPVSSALMEVVPEISEQVKSEEEAHESQTMATTDSVEIEVEVNHEGNHHEISALPFSSEKKEYVTESLDKINSEEETAQTPEQGEEQCPNTEASTLVSLPSSDLPFLSPRDLPARRQPLLKTAPMPVAAKPSSLEIANVSPIQEREQSIFSAFSFSAWAKSPTGKAAPAEVRKVESIDVEKRPLDFTRTFQLMEDASAFQHTMTDKSAPNVKNKARISDRLPSFRVGALDILNPASTDNQEECTTFDESTVFAREDMTITTSFSKLPILEQCDTQIDQPYWNMNEKLESSQFAEWRKASEEGPLPIRLSSFFLALGGITTTILALVLEDSWMISDLILASHMAFFASSIIILEGKVFPCVDRDPSNPRAKLRDILTKYVRVFKYLWGRGLLYILVGSLNVAVEGSYVLCTGIPLILLGIGSVGAGVIYAKKFDKLKSSLTFEVFLWNYFHECDKDQDDHINEQEFKELMHSLGMESDETSFSRAFKQIDPANLNPGSDQMISFEQFKRWWIATQNGGGPLEYV